MNKIDKKLKEQQKNKMPNFVKNMVGNKKFKNQMFLDKTVGGKK
jgi:hypothetical protein